MSNLKGENDVNNLENLINAKNAIEDVMAFSPDRPSKQKVRKQLQVAIDNLQPVINELRATQNASLAQPTDRTQYEGSPIY